MKKAVKEAKEKWRHLPVFLRALLLSSSSTLWLAREHLPCPMLLSRYYLHPYHFLSSICCIRNMHAPATFVFSPNATTVSQQLMEQKTQSNYFQAGWLLGTLLLLLLALVRCRPNQSCPPEASSSSQLPGEPGDGGVGGGEHGSLQWYSRHSTGPSSTSPSRL